MFMEEGQGLIIRNPNSSPIHLKFSQLAFMAKSGIEETNRQIQACLPPTCVQGYNDFQWRSLTDDLLSSQSVFDQPHNQHILQPLCQQLLDSLLSQCMKFQQRNQLYSFISVSSTFLVAEARVWLQHHDHILSSITAAFTLTCGIPPRDFQYQSL